MAPVVPWADVYPVGAPPRSSAAFSRDPNEAHVLVTAPIHPGSHVLEVGCSTGYITEVLVKERGCTVVGVEPNVTAAALTRRKLAVEVFEPTGELADLPDRYLEAFDVVLCADVVEHVSDPAAFLRHLLGFLKPDGRLMLSIPNIAHWSIRWSLLRGRFDYQSTGILAADHLRFFTESSLRRLLDELGLEPHSIRHAAGTWIPQYRLLRRLKICSRIVPPLAVRFPKVFAVQFVVEAARRA
jgi:2-polyprenyl-3-methyl-5-hydroxy-6-metoxy-1,4-benzoquinol methylase